MSRSFAIKRKNPAYLSAVLTFNYIGYKLTLYTESVRDNLAKIISKAEKIIKINCTIRRNIEARIVTNIALALTKVIGKEEEVVKIDRITFAGKPSENRIAIGINWSRYRH